MTAPEAAETQETSVPRTCTVKQLVEELGGEDVISSMTIYRLVREGELAAIRVTERKILIRRDSIAAWLTRSAVPVPNSAAPVLDSPQAPGPRAGEDVA